MVIGAANIQGIVNTRLNTLFEAGTYARGFSNLLNYNNQGIDLLEVEVPPTFVEPFIYGGGVKAITHMLRGDIATVLLDLVVLITTNDNDGLKEFFDEKTAGGRYQARTIIGAFSIITRDYNEELFANQYTDHHGEPLFTDEMAYFVDYINDMLCEHYNYSHPIFSASKEALYG